MTVARVCVWRPVPVIRFLAALGMPRPGTSRMDFIGFVRHVDGDEESNRAFMSELMAFQEEVVMEDVDLVRTMHFRGGTPTRSDRMLVRFLNYVRDFPR